jgi:hypothetical protein
MVAAQRGSNNDHFHAAKNEQSFFVEQELLTHGQ